MSHIEKTAESSNCYIGLMSGTSLDGVDGVLAHIPSASTSGKLQVLAYASLPFDPSLRAELLALNARYGTDELHRAALAGNAVSRVYADVVQQLLHRSQMPAQQIVAIGAHGQTVRHQPRLHDGTGYTLQLQNPALLAELSGITVVADLRSRDVAAGGQGAPLVPAFHQCIFGQSDATVLVLNIGGISNLSILPATGMAVTGFDCGPGNALMDWWCLQHTGQPYDGAGQWAAGGQLVPHLLEILLEEAFLYQAPPKSTGRDLFNPNWLAEKLQVAGTNMAPQDIQATLTAFTARVCADCVHQYGDGARTLLVCGGGALNVELMRQLQALLPDVEVASTAACGMPVLQVEAAAFAWLARQAMYAQPANLPPVTGARGPRILGAVYRG